MAWSASGYAITTPKQGRFTARDPIFFDGSPMNLYAYSGSNPIGHHELTGLECLSGSVGVDTDGEVSGSVGGEDVNDFNGAGERNDDGSWGAKTEGKLVLRRCWQS